MKGSTRGNWDPREGQQPFQSNPNGAVDRTTTLRRLLIVAENEGVGDWITITSTEDLFKLGIDLDFKN